MNMWHFLLTNLLNGIIGILLLIAGYKLFDWATPKWDFYEAFTKHPVAGSVVIGSFILGLSAIICSAAF
ncbi:MAG: DUF350 domain-containing protein [Desulfobacterales bacterium]|nr:DUF350 domain-containing protein [Desulfobacterales bacterium]